MDKDMFKEFYQFKPSDVIKGLNRYFAETKANRYRRVPLEIRKGACFDNPYNVLFCKPEEYVGVAINWLREEHDIFYTPGMEAPVEDFDVDEASKEYEKATRKDKVKYYSENDLREALGIVDEYVDILGTIRKLREERNELKEKYDRLYMSYEKTYRAKFAKLSEERDRYKWLYENLKDGMESVLQEAEERED